MNVRYVLLDERVRLLDGSQSMNIKDFEFTGRWKTYSYREDIPAEALEFEIKYKVLVPVSKWFFFVKYVEKEITDWVSWRSFMWDYTIKETINECN